MKEKKGRIMVSDCHGAEVKIVGFAASCSKAMGVYVCTECNKPCNIEGKRNEKGREK